MRVLLFDGTLLLFFPNFPFTMRRRPSALMRKPCAPLSIGLELEKKENHKRPLVTLIC